MLGREAYQNPYLLAEVDREFYGCEEAPISRKAAALAMLPYIEQELEKGTPINHIVRHMLGLFHAQRGGKQFRRYISENAHKPGAGSEVLLAALERVPD